MHLLPNFVTSHFCLYEPVSCSLRAIFSSSVSKTGDYMLSRGTKERDSRHCDLVVASASQTPPTSFSASLFAAPSATTKGCNLSARHERAHPPAPARTCACATSGRIAGLAAGWEWRDWVVAERPAPPRVGDARQNAATRGSDGGGDPRL